MKILTSYAPTVLILFIEYFFIVKMGANYAKNDRMGSFETRISTCLKFLNFTQCCYETFIIMIVSKSKKKKKMFYKSFPVNFRPISR